MGEAKQKLAYLSLTKHVENIAIYACAFPLLQHVVLVFILTFTENQVTLFSRYEFNRNWTVYQEKWYLECYSQQQSVQQLRLDF